MRAITINRYGPPDELTLSRLERPVPGPGEVLVDVDLATVNTIDWKTRAGRGVRLARFPAILGWDVCGTVVGHGDQDSSWSPGDQVFGMIGFPAGGGAYAESVIAVATDLAALPSTVAPEDAVGVMAAITAWQSLVRHGQSRAGQAVLVHGAAGGVGHLAVQMAKALDCVVTATASPANHPFLYRLGADRAVDYRDPDLARRLDRFDLVLDTRGGDEVLRMLDLVRPGGRLVTILGEDPRYAKAAAARDVTMGYTYVSSDEEALMAVADLLARGVIRTSVQRTYPLAGTADAHAFGEQGHVRGVLAVNPRL